MTITAIETSYAGCLFRSRLEARWAVFFDHLGIRWEYEPQGFDIDGTPYLPDFHLPVFGTWVEVKGSETDLLAKRSLYGRAIDFGGCLPGVGDSLGSERGLLILGEIPRPEVRGMPVHPLLQHSKGVCLSWAAFRTGGLTWMTSDNSSVTWDLPEWNSYTGVNALPDVPQIRSVERAYRAARSARFEHGARP